MGDTHMTHEQIMKQIDIERENRKRIYKNISRFIIAFIVIGGLFIISCLLTRHQVDIIYKMLILLGIVVIAFGYGMMLLMRFLASLEKEIILLTMTLMHDIEGLQHMDYINAYDIENEEDE